MQVKYGPIDFQVREPPSPLFSHLTKTNAAIELQVTQEYLGQQCHLVYLPPLWQTILGYDLRVDNDTSYVRDIIAGETFKRPLGGSAAVVNVGMNQTWLGSHMSMSNLYAYGALAWNPYQDSASILQSWARLTFGMDKDLVQTLTDMSMASWPAYESYSGNLGIQTLTDILYTHYGPNPASQDNNPWGKCCPSSSGRTLSRVSAMGRGVWDALHPRFAAWERRSLGHRTLAHRFETHSKPDLQCSPKCSGVLLLTFARPMDAS